MKKKTAATRLLGLALMLIPIVLACTEFSVASWLDRGEPRVTYVSGGKPSLASETDPFRLQAEVYIKRPLVVESCTVTINGKTLTMQPTLVWNFTNGETIDGVRAVDYNDCVFAVTTTMQNLGATWNTTYTVVYRAVYQNFAHEKTRTITFVRGQTEDTTEQDITAPFPQTVAFYIASFALGAFSFVLSYRMETT